MTARFASLSCLLALALAACTQPVPETKPTSGPKQIGDYKVGDPYQIAGVWYYPSVDYSYAETGIASWYGPGFHGKRTANGEVYDQDDMTAAHRTLPMPSLVRVTNLDNGRALQVRINDRGPFKNGRIIDLSHRAASLLGFVGSGTAKVRVEILEPESRRLAALAQQGQAAAAAPDAAPMVAVTEVPLEGLDASAAPAEDVSARPRLAALAPVAEPGGAEGAWLLEDRSGVIETLRGAEAANESPLPDGRVTVQPVEATKIYVQAGSFLRRDFATRMSARLSRLGRSRVTEALVGDRVFFRVRLGPVATVDEADQLLATLLAQGVGDARVIVD